MFGEKWWMLETDNDSKVIRINQLEKQLAEVEEAYNAMRQERDIEIQKRLNHKSTYEQRIYYWEEEVNKFRNKLDAIREAIGYI